MSLKPSDKNDAEEGSDFNNNGDASQPDPSSVPPPEPAQVPLPDPDEDDTPSDPEVPPPSQN